MEFVRAGGLHVIVGWLDSAELPQLQHAAVSTLHTMLEACPSEQAQVAVAALAAELGGSAVIKALEDPGSMSAAGGGGSATEARKSRGRFQVSFGATGSKQRWGLRMRGSGASAQVLSVSVSAGAGADGAAERAASEGASATLRPGLRLASVDGWSTAKHGGSVLAALDAATAAVRRHSEGGLWRGQRVLTLTFYDPQWISGHLVREGDAQVKRRNDRLLFAC